MSAPDAIKLQHVGIRWQFYETFGIIVFKAIQSPFRHHQQSWNLFIQPPNLGVWQRSLNADSFEFRY